MHNNHQMRKYQPPHLQPLHFHLSSSNKADSKQQPTFINKLKKKKKKNYWHQIILYNENGRDHIHTITNLDAR